MWIYLFQSGSIYSAKSTLDKFELMEGKLPKDFNALLYKSKTAKKT